MSLGWICPYCDRAATIQGTLDRRAESVSSDGLTNKDGLKTAIVQYTACPNADCKRLTVELIFGTGLIHTDLRTSRVILSKALRTIRVQPPNYARAMPSYVPGPIREDYEEACAIADLSPKAAATLARRALQGMIRDFFGIVEKTLYKEIQD